MKTVVISGGTSGIGKRLVELFLNEKMKVFTFSSKKKNVISFTKEFEEFKKESLDYSKKLHKNSLFLPMFNGLQKKSLLLSM